MQFLLLVYHDEKRWIDLSNELRSAVYKDYRAFVEQMTERGCFREGGECEPSPHASVVRVRNGKTITSPVAIDSSGEQLAGFFVIEANNVAAAIGMDQSRFEPFAAVEARRYPFWR